MIIKFLSATQVRALPSIRLLAAGYWLLIHLDAICTQLSAIPVISLIWHTLPVLWNSDKCFAIRTTLNISTVQGGMAGKMCIHTDNIELAGDMLQDLATFCQVVAALSAH